MGAFIVFPVLIFSIFITAIMGFSDFIHVDTLVHDAAQTAVDAASENAATPGNTGIYQQGLGQGQGQGQGAGHAPNVQGMPLDASSATATVSQMLTGKPYITSYTCSTSGNQVTCQVNFSVWVPIVGKVNATTSASSSNATS